MPSETRQIERARERYLSAAAESPALRPEIAASWRRSTLSGVSADGLPAVPVAETDEAGTRLLQVARPVLDRLAEELAGTVTSIIITDARVRIVARYVGEKGLQSSLDRVLAVPGACYGEDIVGTNGLGTSIERRQPTVVVGSEHFHDMLRGFTCVGVPLVHPISGQLHGVLDLTCRYEDTNELMLPMALEAGREITRRLCETASTVERLLLERFLAASRRTAHPVVALNREVIITNSAAARLLEPADHALLWESATRALGGGSTGETVLGTGSATRHRVRPVTDGRDVVGALVELDVAAPGPGRRVADRRPLDALPGLVGRSGGWQAVCAAARESATAKLPTAVLGEPGTGKVAVARAIHELNGPTGRWSIIDAALVAVDGPGAWLSLLRAGLAEPGTVVVRHLDLLPTAVAVAATDVVDGADPGCHVVGTAPAEWPEVAPRSLVDRFPVRVDLPSLPARAIDIPLLLDAVSTRCGAEDVRWTGEAVQALVRGLWPGNVRELEAIVRRTVARRRTGDIGVGDLPAEYRAAAGRRRLAGLERLERDAIVRALADAEGRKSEAAASLGISRATLYRKLASYAITWDRPR